MWKVGYQSDLRWKRKSIHGHRRGSGPIVTEWTLLVAIFSLSQSKRCVLWLGVNWYLETCEFPHWDIQHTHRRRRKRIEDREFSPTERWMPQTLHDFQCRQIAVLFTLHKLPSCNRESCSRCGLHTKKWLIGDRGTHITVSLLLHHPIWLPYLSKVLERAVGPQLKSYLNLHNLYEPFQSGFRSKHSTETALLPYWKSQMTYSSLLTLASSPSSSSLTSAPSSSHVSSTLLT